MFKFSRKLDYAILATAHLAAEPTGSPVSARSLAERSRIPGAILANILKDLTRAGVVNSSRGVHGGYELALSPEQLSVGGLIRALEGPTRLVECVLLEGETTSPASCQIEPDCPVKAPLRRVHDRIHSVLEDMTFAEVISEGAFASLQR